MKQKISLFISLFFLAFFLSALIFWGYKNNSNKNSKMFLSNKKEIERKENKNTTSLEKAKNQKFFEVEMKPDIKYDKICFDCNLDLYRPLEKADLSPVIIYVHENNGDKEIEQNKGKFFAKRGFVFLAINYFLIKEEDDSDEDFTYRDQVNNLATAIKWTDDNIENYGGDKNKIILIGYASGAHLISLISTDNTYLKALDLGTDKIKKAILLEPIALDVLKSKTLFPRNFKKEYQIIFGDDEEDLKKASPKYFIAKNEKLPDFLIFYSSFRENLKTEINSFQEELDKFGVKNKAIAFRLPHKDMNKLINYPNGNIGDEILKYLNNDL